MFGNNAEHKKTNALLERIAIAMETQLKLQHDAQNVDVGAKVSEIFEAIGNTNPLLKQATASMLPGGK